MSVTLLFVISCVCVRVWGEGLGRRRACARMCDALGCALMYVWRVRVRARREGRWLATLLSACVCARVRDALLFVLSRVCVRAWG